MPLTVAADWSYPAASGGISNTTTAVTIKAAASDGRVNTIQSIQYEWESLTTACELAIRDGAGGAVLWRTKLPSGAAGRNSINFQQPIIGSPNTLLEVLTITASGGGAVYFNAQGNVAR